MKGHVHLILTKIDLDISVEFTSAYASDMVLPVVG